MLVQLDGALDVVTGQLIVTVPLTVGWGQLGFWSESPYDRQYGRMFCYDLTPSNEIQMAQLGMLSAAGLVRDNDVAGIVFAEPGVILAREGTSERQVGTYTAAKQRIAHILRSNGYVLAAEVSGVWTVLWVSLAGNTGPVYPHFDSYSMGCVLDNVVIGRFPNWRLFPLASDSFNRSDNADPNAGGGTDGAAVEESAGAYKAWVSQGDWQIKNNRLEMASGSSNGSCVVDSGQADGIVIATCQAATGTKTFGLVVRHAAGVGGVVAGLTPTGVHELFDWDGGATLTPNATGSQAISAGTDYELAVYVEGDSIVSYVNGGDRLEYSGTPPSGRTEQGVFGSDTGHDADDFVVFPRIAANLPFPAPG